MKFAIKGADSSTGLNVQIVLDAPDEAAALQLAQSQGIRVSGVHPWTDPPSHPAGSAAAPGGPGTLSNAAMPRDEIQGSRLADVFLFLAVALFVIAVLGGYVTAAKGDVGAGFGFFFVCCIGGFLLLAVAHLLDWGFEAVQHLRKISRLLESRRS